MKQFAKVSSFVKESTDESLSLQWVKSLYCPVMNSICTSVYPMWLLLCLIFFSTGKTTTVQTQMQCRVPGREIVEVLISGRSQDRRKTGLRNIQRFFP